jgi:hypothetical protein
MNINLEERLSSLERSNRRWRVAFVSMLLVGLGGALIAQTSGPGIQSTILCRGIKIFDPQGRKRGEFVMANGNVAVRMFDADGNDLAKLDVDELTFNDLSGKPVSKLSFVHGLELGDPDAGQTVITPGGFSLYDSTHHARAIISLGRTPHFSTTTEPEQPNLLLFRHTTGGYEASTYGNSFFSN